MRIISVTNENLRSFAPYLSEYGGANGPVLFGAETEEGEAAGVAAFSPNGTWTELSYIYVRPAFRRQGVGSRLLHDAGELMPELREQPVLVDFSEGAEGLRAFLEAAGFYVCPGKAFFEFALKDAVRLLTGDREEPAEGIRTVADMNREERELLFHFIEGKGWSGEVLNEPSVSEEFSLACFTDGRINGALVMSRENDRCFRIDLVAAAKGSLRVFSALLRTLIRGMRRTEKAGTLIRFFGENEKLVETGKRMLGDSLKKAEPYYTAVG